MKKHQRKAIVDVMVALAQAIEKDEEEAAPLDGMSPSYFAADKAVTALDELLKADEVARKRKKADRLTACRPHQFIQFRDMPPRCGVCEYTPSRQEIKQA